MRSRAETMRRYLYRGERGRLWRSGVVSLALHLLGFAGWMQLPAQPPPRPEPPILHISLVSRGEHQADAADSAEAAEEAAEEQVAPVVPAPAPAAKPTKAPQAPVLELPPAPTGIAAHTEPTPPAPTPPSPPRSFASWRQGRMTPYMPSHFPTRGGFGGQDASSNDGRDKCEPFPSRHLERLILLYDSSGSMSGRLEDQALRCAQQYAKAALDDGATVVVGNFARSTVLAEPTRSMFDVAAALRAENDHSATELPSKELYRFFDDAPGAATDLVILSDGYIPNYRTAMASYRYFLELNPDNRGYLYTLGQRGHPDVTAALQDIGFDVYVYRIF